MRFSEYALGCIGIRNRIWNANGDIGKSQQDFAGEENALNALAAAELEPSRYLRLPIVTRVLTG